MEPEELCAKNTQNEEVSCRIHLSKRLFEKHDTFGVEFAGAHVRNDMRWSLPGAWFCCDSNMFSIDFRCPGPLYHCGILLTG